MSKTKYDTLVLSGGGTTGIIILGVLHYIMENRKEMLNDIKYYSGTSAGAYINYLLVLNYTPMEIFTYACSKVDNITLNNLSINNLLNKHGVIGNEFINHLKVLTLEKTGKEDITFKELYDEYKKELVVCTFNATQNETQYFSYTLSPSMSCIEALRLSSAIPFVFTKQYYKDELYLDGAITNNFPIQQIYTPYTTNEKNSKKHILGITIEDTSHINDDNLLNYIISVLQLVIDQCQTTVIPPNSFILSIVNETKHSSVNFNTKTTDKIHLFQFGESQANIKLHPKLD
jgi:predicted acylesterase/phospholipase RssA